MIAISIAAMALLGLSSAQSTVSLFIPGADPQSLVGSIAGSSGPATTYVIECTGEDNCGLPAPITVVGGASTLHVSISAPELTVDVGCAVSGSTSAVCVESAIGSAANFPSVSTTTLAASEINYIPVVITAGAGVSGQQSATATSSATASSSSTPGVSSTSSAGVAAAPGGSSSTQSSMATSTSGHSSSTPTSTGSSTASNSGSVSATGANSTHTGGTMQTVEGSGKAALGALAVLFAMAMVAL